MPKKEKKSLSDITLFYVHAGLFSFAEIILVISIPVLLWKQGYPLSIIFAAYGLAALPGYLFTKKTVEYALSTSLKKVFILGTLLYVLVGSIMPFLQPTNYIWVVVFILLSLQALCYFPSRHLYFTEIISKGKVGVQSGRLNAVMIVARTIAPIIAGSIAILIEFNLVFFFAAFIMTLSVIPIFLIKTEVKTTFNKSEFKKAQKNPVFLNTKHPYIAEGANGFISFILWPILFFIFISQSDYFELGSLMTVSYGISAIIMVIVGHFFDKRHRKKLLRISITSNILATLGRFTLLFFHPLILVYGIQSFYSFSESALQSTFHAYWFSYSKKTNTALFTIHREKNYSLGRFIIGSSMAIISIFLTDAQSLWPFFLLSIPIIFIYLKKEDSDHVLNK